jgi:hypothetical protein
LKMAARKGGFIDFRNIYPKAQLQGTAGTNLSTAAQTQTAADTTHDIYETHGVPFTLYHGAAGTAFSPLSGVTGWGLPVDATDNEGNLLTIGNGLSNADLPWCFTVGTDPAFYMRWCGITANPTVADALADCAFFFGGFRTAGAYSANNAIAQMTTQALMTSDADATPFADMAAMSVAYTATAQIYTLFKTNSLAGANVDTAVVAADGVKWTFEVDVSAAGVVSCKYNVAGGTTLTAYAVSPGTLTAAVVVQPMVGFINGATATGSGASILQSIAWGLQ